MVRRVPVWRWHFHQARLLPGSDLHTKLSPLAWPCRTMGCPAPAGPGGHNTTHGWGGQGQLHPSHLHWEQLRTPGLVEGGHSPGQARSPPGARSAPAPNVSHKLSKMNLFQ